jgi:pectate lyase
VAKPRKELKMLERYSVTVRLTGGSVHNFNNADGTECKVGDVIKMGAKAHNRENAIKAIKHTLSFCHVKYEIL